MRGIFDSAWWDELNIALFKDFASDSNVACLIDTEARVIPVLHTAFAFAFRPPALFFDSLFSCTMMSTSKRPTIYQRISSKFQSKSSASGNTLNNEPTRDCQSPALDNARMIFQLASNIGSGGLNVPGLQAAGLIGVQIIDAVKVGIMVSSSFSMLFWGERISSSEIQI